MMRRPTLSTSLLATAVLVCAPGCSKDAKPGAYDAELAAWVEAGYPTTPAEMLPAPVADERNAVTYYLEAGRLIEALPAADLETLKADANKYSYARIAPRLKPILAVAEQGRACDACVWPVNVEDPQSFYGSSISYTRAMRDIARLYHAMALAESAEGNHEQAMRLIEAGLEIASDLDTVPIAIQSMVKYAMQHLILDAYRQAFAEGDLPASRVARRLADTTPQRDQEDAVLLETSIWIASFEDGHYDDRLTSDADRAAARTEMAWLLENVKRALAGDVETVKASNLQTWPQPRVLFDGQAPPQPWSPLQFVDRHASMVELHRLGVELREYKAEHGEYPETFDTPIDPLTGEPFVYEKTTTGCVVSSGTDLKRPVEWRWE